MNKLRTLFFAAAGLALAFQSIGAQEHSGASTAVPALAVEADGPAGHVRLQYTQGGGWHVASVQAPKSAGLSPATTASPDADLSQDPQTLFIDGPSGIVYGFFVDRGWGLIGQLSTKTKLAKGTK
jgi:hypothetical protein